MKIKRPTLLLNEEKCRNNIRRMADKAHSNGLIFRPHFKTHQSAEVGKWFRDAGADRITVSSVEMATYFANHGWNDITIAFPVNILEIEEINRLASNINLNLLVESIHTTNFLSAHLKHNSGVFIEIDTGYYRSGIMFDDPEQIDKIIRMADASSSLEFKGFLTHMGHAYNAGSENEISSIYEDTHLKMTELKNHSINISRDPIISIGDTPSCSMMNDFKGIDEIRPGNFVFYDVMQAELGACSLEDIAVALACPIVAKYPERDEIIIYGGAIHLSKDHIVKNDKKIFGYLAKLEEAGWKPFDTVNYVSSVSQEHGIIKVSNEILAQYNPGDLIGVLPAHSCLTANLMKKYQLLDGRVISRGLV